MMDDFHTSKQCCSQRVRAEHQSATAWSNVQPELSHADMPVELCEAAVLQKHVFLEFDTYAANNLITIFVALASDVTCSVQWLQRRISPRFKGKNS